MNDILFNVWLVSRTKFNFNIVMYFCFRRNSQGFELSIYLETWENGPLCNVIQFHQFNEHCTCLFIY